MKRAVLLLLIALLLLGGAAAVVWWQGWLLHISIATEQSMPASGAWENVARLSMTGFGRRSWKHVTATINGSPVDIGTKLFIGGPSDAVVTSRAPASPQTQTLHITSPRFFGHRSITRKLRFALDTTDSFSDGTPDFLRLHTDEDRRAFRAWFTLMADTLYDLDPKKLPAGVTDCSGLLRYAYREALLDHDDRWFADSRAQGILTVMPPLPTIAQYHYPDTPLGAALFRVKPGSFMPEDLANGSFAQFADAKSLMQWNTHFISRDIHMARPGDVIFYRQLGQNSPYHSMIITSNDPGAATSAAATLVVYHTGPVGREPGEVRRMTIVDLLHHPDARWHPVPENPNFLGVYRWNILREEE